MSETPSVQHKTLADALAAFQLSLPHIGKGETAIIPPKDGKSGFKYTYADLADVSQAVLPQLAKHGLAWSCRPTLDDSGRFVLAYRLMHSSGEFLDGAYPLGSGTAQQIGSAITYARRYCLAAVVGVAPDADDDGQAANHADPWRQSPEQAPTPAVETDVEWASDFLHRVSEADSDGVLRGLWSELVAQVTAGKVHPDEAEGMRNVITARKAEIAA